MTTYNTGNSLGSAAAKDLYDNAQNFDHLSNDQVNETWDDRFSVPRLTWHGMEVRYQEKLTSMGWSLIDSFQDGANLTRADQALRWATPDGDGEYYRWDGAFPKNVPENSTPETTGGVGVGAWIGVGDASLRSSLSSSNDGNGDSLVSVKQPKPNTIARTQHDFNADFINVKDYGAKGNWNATTQTGDDDTAAFQAAINDLGTATYRNGGVRVLRIPAGNYKITSVTIPASLTFGVNIVGDGKFSSIIWADNSNLSPAFNSEIEFVHFDSLGLYGSLSQSGLSTDWKQCFYKGKLATNLPDVDVTFTNCALGHSVDFIQAYGRGVVIDPTCTAFYCTNLLNIVCDESTTFPGGATKSMQTGMRNYNISPSRLDVVSVMVKVTGSGPQKDYINDIVINCPDMAAVDRVIDFPDAIVQRVLINGGTGIDCFQSGVVTGKRVVDMSINLMAAKQYNRDLTSTRFINGLVALTSSATNLRITGNYRDLCAYAVSVGAASQNINIDIQVLNLAINGNAFTAVTGANVSGLRFNIECTGAIPSATCRFFQESTQLSPVYECRSTGKTLVRPSCVFTPSWFVAGVSQTLAWSRGEVRSDGNYAYVTISLSYTRSGTSGNAVYMGLYGTPVADNPTLTTSMCGQVVIEYCAYKQILRGEIDAANKRIQFYKPDGNTLVESDLPSVFSIKLTAKYPMIIG